MEKISAAVAWRLADRLRSDGDSKQQQSGIAEFVRMDSDGTAWIRIPGNNFDTPVEGGVFVDAKEGDTVTYTISGGQVSISGNATSPAVGGTYVTEKVKPVERKANSAIASAEQARTAADMATAEAGRASEAADAAQTSADNAATAAGNAQSSADNAATAAQQAIEDAATADGKAEAAATAASNAQTSASSAASAASAAQTSANSAAAAAAVADEKAVAAGNAAAAAQRSANSANTYANAALDQLGIVQDVIGVLTWATEHGSFTLTSDTTIVDGKVYFTYDSQTGDYTPVIDPQASALSTYYELSVDEAMESYIMAHLAVTSRGLWVLPSGIGSGTTPASGESQADSDARQGSGYKMLLASNGMYLYDANGVVATNVGENITFSSDRDWYVGSNDAYIFFDASEGVINIGGTGVEFNGTKTLSVLLSDVSSAASAASAAQSTADGANGREQLIYRSAASGTSSMSANTTWVTDATGGQNKWTTVRPEYSQTYPVLFVATQRQTVAQTSGTACTCTTPAIDKTTTVIDGGRIITGSVTADQIDATNLHVSSANIDGTISANKIDAASLTIGYSQLTDTPSIPSKTSDLTNDSSFATTTQVSTAKSEAISSAASDATTKANAAQSAAEATAAADATAKANDAKKYATNYISADETGIRIADANPSERTTYQHQTANETEFVVNGVSRTLISGDGLRIGDTNESHVVIDSMSQTFYDGNQNEVFKIKSGYIAEETMGDRVAVIVTPTDRITDPDALYIYRIDINDTALSDDDWTVLDDGETVVFTSTVSGDISIYYDGPSETVYYQAPQVVIGDDNGKNHMYLDYQTMQMIDSAGNAYFNISNPSSSSGLMRMGYATGNRVEVTANGVATRSGSSNNYTLVDSTGFKAYLSDALRMLLDGTVLRVYDGNGTATGNVLANFGETTVIGKQGNQQVISSTDGLRVATTTYSGGTYTVGQDATHVDDSGVTIGHTTGTTSANYRATLGAGKETVTVISDITVDGTMSASTSNSSRFTVNTLSGKRASGNKGTFIGADYIGAEDGIFDQVSVNSKLLVTGSIKSTSTQTIYGASLVTTASTIHDGTEVSSATGGSGVYFRTSEGTNLGYVRSYASSSSSGSPRWRGVQLVGLNDSSDVGNNLFLQVDKDGNRRVVVSAAKPWCDAFGLGTVKTESPSAVSVTSSSYVTLGTITLDAGVWVVSISATFESNGNGRRAVYFGTTSTASSINVDQSGSATLAPAVGGMTKFSTSTIESINSSTTFYCRAWQNSGSALSCRCYLSAVRVGRT